MVRWTEGDRAAACARGLLADEAVLRACSILVPHHGPGGISLALRGYVAVEGPEVAAFEQAVKRIVTVLERGEAEDPPAIASAPVTRYWIDVAPRLPAEFALRMGEGFRRLMMRSPSAWANGTVLYCALDHLAKHIVTDRPRCGRLLAGDHAVVLEPEIWAGLTERAAHDLPTALRTALGLTAGPTEGARRPSNGGKAKRKRPRSLQAILDDVAPGGQKGRKSEESEDPAGRRHGWGLATNRAAGIAIGLGDADPYEIGELLDTLMRAELSVGNAQVLIALVRLSFMTGWSFSTIAEFGPNGRAAFDRASAEVHFAGDMYQGATGLAGRTVRLGVGPEVVGILSELTQSVGIRLMGRWGLISPEDGHLRAVLGYHMERSGWRLTSSCLRGAIWHTGSALGCPWEHLVLGTLAWDPGFKAAFTYLRLPSLLDLSALHEVMAEKLQMGLKAWPIVVTEPPR